MRHFPASSLRRSFQAATAGIALLLAATATTHAADPELVGVLALFDDPVVVKEVGISDATKDKIFAVIDKYEPQALNFKDLEGEERAAKVMELRIRAEQEGIRLLTDPQKLKLNDIRKRRPAEASPATTAKVQAPAESPDESRVDKPAASPAESTDEPRSDRSGDMADADDEEERGPPSRTPGRFSRGPERSESPRDAREGSTRSAPATGGATTPGAYTAAKPLPVEPLDPDGKIRFKFSYQPWGSVLDWFARVNGYSLYMENPPQGTFNYTDEEGYTPAEAIDLLNSYLLTKGMVIVRNRKMMMVVRIDEVPAILVPYVAETDLEGRGEYELVKTVFQLERSTPDDIEAEIRPMVGPQGQIVKLVKAKQIQIVETAGRLRAIRKVIQGIENPPPSTDDKLHPIQLTHVKADQIIPSIQQQFQMAPGTMVTPDGSLRLLLEPVSGRLFVSGKQEQRNKLAELIKVLDQPNPSGPTKRETPNFVVYSISVADSQAVLAVLQTLLAGQPDVRLGIDAKTGHINALATPTQHSTIKAIIDEMQSDGREIDVIHLRYVDPELAVLIIGKLFATETNPANAPIVDADPLNNRLIVRASKAQLQQIRDALQKMGESPDSGDDTLLASGKGTVRVMQMSPRQARSIIGEIEPFWSKQRENKIRIIAPAAGTPDRGLPPPNSRRNDELDEMESQLRREFLPEESNSQPVLEPRTIRKYQSGDEFVPPAAAPADRSTHYTPTLDRIRVVAVNRPNLAPGADSTTGKYIGGNAPKRVAARYVAQQADETEAAPAPTTTAPAPRTEPKAEAAAPAAQPDAATDAAPKSVPGAEIIVRVTPGGLVIASDDLEALDEFEDMVNQFLDTTESGGREFTVFYLQFIKAEHAKQLLDEVLAGGGGDSGGGGGSLFGDIAGAALGGGGGLLGGLLGGGGDTFGGGSSSLIIVADPRQNSLIVQGATTDIDTVEQLLQVVDRKDGGLAEKQLADQPRFIPVYNNPATEIAETVKLVYADRINVGGANAQQQQQQRQPSPEEFIRMLRGGGGRGGRGGRGGGGGGSEGINREDVEKVSVNVDTRSNSLIVVAPDYIYNDMQDLVKTLDTVSAASQQDQIIVELKNVSPQAMQQALAQTFGDKVVTSSSTTSRPSTTSTTGTPPSSSTPQTNNQPQTFTPSPFPFGGAGGGFPFGGGQFGGGGDRGGGFGEGGRGGGRGGFGQGGGGSGRGGGRGGRGR
jgi:type II secretory pathway component GspD/PulD (secretin)